VLGVSGEGKPRPCVRAGVARYTTSMRDPTSATLAAMSKCLARSNKSGGRAQTTKGRPTESSLRERGRTDDAGASLFGLRRGNSSVSATMRSRSMTAVAVTAATRSASFPNECDGY
jgi:hypothetical protein